MKAFILSLVISSSLLVAEKQRAQPVIDSHKLELSSGIDAMDNKQNLTVIMDDGNTLTLEQIKELYNNINH